VDEGRIGTKGPGRDDDALHELVRVALHELAVVERPRFGLVEVDDQIGGLADVLRDEGPLLPGGEARASPPPEPRGLYLLDDLVRVHRQRLTQRPLASG